MYQKCNWTFTYKIEMIFRLVHKVKQFYIAYKPTFKTK